MQGAAQRRYEEGRPIGKWRHGLTRRAGIEGELSLASEYVPALRDHAMVARFTSAAGDELLPPLLQGAVAYWKDDEVRVTGLQHDELYNTYTAQAWSIAVPALRVAVRQRYECGQPVANWRAGADAQDGVQGIFTLVEETIGGLNDRALVARLTTDSGICVPPLLRASIRVVKGNLLSVIGLEHHAEFDQYTAQAWAGELIAT